MHMIMQLRKSRGAFRFTHMRAFIYSIRYIYIIDIL